MTRSQRFVVDSPLPVRCPDQQRIRLQRTVRPPIRFGMENEGVFLISIPVDVLVGAYGRVSWVSV